MMTREQINKLKEERPERLHLYYQYASYKIYELDETPVSFEEWDKHCDDEGRWVK